MTLDVGPGINVQPHFDQPVIRVDRRLETKPDVVADARALPFKDRSFSTVYASHVLEHFKRNDTEPMLAEWWRLVGYTGELHVFVPNMEWAAFQILKGIVDGTVWHCVYGRQNYDLDVHRSGWTPKTLEALLWNLPLVKDIDMRLFRNSICCWVTKE